MDLKIILIYCVCSDFLKRTKTFCNDSYQMTDSEVLTFAIVSAMFFHGNHEKLVNFYVSMAISLIYLVKAI